MRLAPANRRFVDADSPRGTRLPVARHYGGQCQRGRAPQIWGLSTESGPAEQPGESALRHTQPCTQLELNELTQLSAPWLCVIFLKWGHSDRPGALDSTRRACPFFERKPEEVPANEIPEDSAHSVT